MNSSWKTQQVFLPSSLPGRKRKGVSSEHGGCSQGTINNHRQNLWKSEIGKIDSAQLQKEFYGYAQALGSILESKGNHSCSVPSVIPSPNPRAVILFGNTQVMVSCQQHLPSTPHPQSLFSPAPIFLKIRRRAKLPPMIHKGPVSPPFALSLDLFSGTLQSFTPGTTLAPSRPIAFCTCSAFSLRPLCSSAGQHLSIDFSSSQLNYCFLTQLN